MDVINCLIVDDEPLARELLVTYCSHLPALRVIAVCGNVFEAKKILETTAVGILFLDVQLPVLDGIGFLSTLKQQPQVIMTTAFREYAATAFDLAVCDYLVKPFSLERFMIAVDKATDKLNIPAPRFNEKNTGEENYVFIKTDGKIYRIEYADLLLAEANGNYSKIFTSGQVILTATNFSSLEKLLPSRQFIKVHRSFIINKSKISRIEGNRVFIGEREIPIGKNYKQAFFLELGL
ncbi:LytR/AlgR family response regulator transcription factor [Chitinophaga arvensicola]|uniref:DNA-binding response regulator, LytR/AlgR family n=1 Tax=Chitinophaga arvensicola TaxID=29529 RepID=A0A1I0SCL4_9BACT|nr:LytTR family DNA-binding domain-containing protein [Chitinophaga arvensicola]SEW55044.1 DNA-binding response regulator, LytR/AlgR family [Chitinophaga arvensicola]